MSSMIFCMPSSVSMGRAFISRCARGFLAFGCGKTGAALGGLGTGPWFVACGCGVAVRAGAGDATDVPKTLRP
jgi:hypothetical protein